MAIFGDVLFLTSSLEVQAYSLASGELLWQNQVLPGHTGSVIAATSASGLTIYYTVYNPVRKLAVVITLDPQTGTLIERVDYPLLEFAAMAPYSGDRILWLSGQDVWLAASPASPPLWHMHAPDPILRWPLEYRRTLIVSFGFFPQIMAIDLATGDVLWQDQRQFVSLPASYGGLIYAITRDAELIALDPATGSQRGSVRFSPLTPEEGSRSYLYTIAASDKILAVYFGDSCQLFVFARPAA